MIPEMPMPQPAIASPRWGIVLLAALTAMALALGGCQRDETKGDDLALAKGDLTPEEKAEIVARVDDAVITLEQFESRLNQQSPFARARYDSPQRKKEFLDGLVRFELIAAEAQRKGYGEHPDVVLARKQEMVRQFTAGELRDLVKLEDITEADVRGYYDANQDEFDRPAQVRAAHLLAKTEDDARRLLAQARELIAADPLKARDVFARVVREASEDDATRVKGGDLGFFGEPGVSKTIDQGQVPVAVARAAFGLAAVGDLAPEPIKTGAGWHLVQKTGFRRPYKRQFEDVRTSIRNTLFRQRKGKAMEQYVADLRAKAKIEIDEARLAEAKARPQTGPLPRIAPPGMEAGRTRLPGPRTRPRLPLPGARPTPAAPPSGQGAPR